jgi:hypothetical protein
LPGRGGQTPGGAEISSEIFLGPLRSILRRTGYGRRFAAGQIKSPWEEALATSEAIGEGEPPLEGTKAQGRIEPHPLLAAKEATDFRGVYCPGGERGGIGQELMRPLEPTPGG